MKKSMKDISLLILLFGLFIVSCDKMDENYSKYLEGGEINYSSRPLDIQGQSGFKRVQLSWKLTTVNNIKECIVAYNDKLITIPITSPQDTAISYLVENLEEGIYNFEVFSLGNNDNKSLISRVTTSAYGNKYKNELATQKLDNFFYAEEKLNFDVIGDYKNLIGFIIQYTTEDDQNESKFYEKGETVEGINIKSGSEIKISSGYLPEITAIDTIYSQPNSYVAPPKSYILDKSLFKLANLPMDLPRFDPSVPNQEKDWLHAWDGDNGTVKVFLERNNAKPAFVTIDLGVKVQLTKFDLVGFLPYTAITPRRYQVWGIGDDMDINEAATTVDLHDISSLSPEELADPEKVAAKKSENFEAWKTEALDKGWKLLIDDYRADNEATGYSQSITDETKIRYVRLVFFDNYSDSNPDIGLSEISFTGLVPTE